MRSRRPETLSACPMSSRSTIRLSTLSTTAICRFCRHCAEWTVLRDGLASTGSRSAAYGPLAAVAFGAPPPPGTRRCTRWRSSTGYGGMDVRRQRVDERLSTSTAGALAVGGVLPCGNGSRIVAFHSTDAVADARFCVGVVDVLDELVLGSMAGGCVHMGGRLPARKAPIAPASALLDDAPGLSR